jgi:hypothetical protein
MSFMRRLMTQKIGSTFIPYEDIFFGYGIAVTIVAPNGSDTANIRMWGAGGGGAGGNSSVAGWANGGGGGGFTIKKGLSVTGGSSTLVITPGAPGANSSANALGGNGGSTTITGAITLTSTGGGGANGRTSVGSAGTKDASGDVGSEDGQPGTANSAQTGFAYGGNTGGLSFVTVSGGGDANTGVPPGAGGRGGFYVGSPVFFGISALSGEAGLVKVRWTKSNGSNTAAYKIYNVPLTFTTTAAPTYATCSIQQTYTTTTTRRVWEDEAYRIASCQFVRAFTANNTTNTCDYDQTNSSFTVGIIQSVSPYSQIAQDFFTSVITPSGVELMTADATGWALSGDTTVWFWYNVPNDLFTAGTNVNVRFKV